MAKKFEVEVTVPEGFSAGDTFTIEVEAPVMRRGALKGIAVEDMDSEQIAREIINAKSVLYKYTHSGREIDEEKLAAKQARVDAALAHRDYLMNALPPATDECDEDVELEDVELEEVEAISGNFGDVDISVD